MRPRELQYAIDNGEIGKINLAKLYLEQKVGTDSSMTRDSVV